MFFMLLKAIKQQEEDAAAAPTATGPTATGPDEDVDRVARRVLELLDEQRLTKQS